MSRAVGIDLGTTNSVVAVMEGDKPVVIVNSEGGRTTPSVVAMTPEEKRLVGQLARRQSVLNPEGTVSSVKRFMGRKFSEVDSEREIVPYEVVEGKNGTARIRVRGAEHAPEEISAQVLRKLVEDASAYLGEKVTEAVITVPAYFNDAQRQATKDAGRIAGLNVLRIINEPTAAALAYGLDKKHDQTVLVFDLGGGTFDVSVLDMGEGVCEVKSTAGDTHLGGDDFDRCIVEWLADTFRKEQGIDLRQDAQALQRLYEAAEKAKCELSTTAETTISLPFITADAQGPRHLEARLSRARFEELTDALLKRIMGPVNRALADAGLEPSGIHEVLLVGGSTRMPAVQALVKRITGGREPNMTVNPDEVVALGAAVQAGRHHPGRREGRTAPGRDAALAGPGDHGRGDDPAHRTQHHHPHPQVPGVQHGRGQPAGRGRGGAARRTGHGPRQPADRPLQAGGHPAGATRHAADRGDV